MMKRLADKFPPLFAITIFSLALCAAGVGSTARGADLLAQANDQTLWIAQVNETPPPRTKKMRSPFST